MAGGQPAVEKNFWLWGTWAKRKISAPFLTQKVPGRIRDVVIGQSFIIALQENGSLMSWGEDKVGCLGLSTDLTSCPEPREISFPPGFSGRVVDVQYGKRHVLALTSEGKIYTWGDNTGGQLGLNDTQTRFEPTWVEELKHCTVVQVLAVDSMSYALTSKGVVYAWGDNKEGALGLEHDSQKVLRPEPMLRMRDTHVKKLMVKDTGVVGSKGAKTVLAIVEMAGPLSPKDLPGGYDRPLGEPAVEVRAEVLVPEKEREIFEGVDLMRRVLDNTLDSWNHLLEMRHGAPYDDGEDDEELDAARAVEDRVSVRSTALQIDTFVGPDILDHAARDLDRLIVGAKEQLREIKKKERGTKNVRLVLEIFVDDCRLRKEKIRSTLAARQLMEQKRSISQTVVLKDLSSREELRRLGEANVQLTQLLHTVRAQKQVVKVHNSVNRALQDSLAECIELKLQVQETQLECLKARGDQPSDVTLPALRVIKERWAALKQFSIYSLYQEFQLRPPTGQAFNSDEELLTFLAHDSDTKIDQIIRIDKDKMVSRDLMVPALCYDLLVENAELRKMCNTYQLKVLLMRQAPQSTVGGSSSAAAAATKR